MENTLARVAAINDQTQKIEQYKNILFTIFSSNDIVQAKTFIDHILSDAVPLVVSQQMLEIFTQELERLNEETREEIGDYTLAQIQPRLASFEGQSISIREKLANLYAAAEQWSKAARILGGIDLDSGSEKKTDFWPESRTMEDGSRLLTYIEISRLYLEDFDAVNAEASLTKAVFLVENSQDKFLNLHFKICAVRIMDMKGEFLEAALCYYDISQTERGETEDEIITEEVLEDALVGAVVCTILATCCPKRSQVLANLYKDERCSKLKTYPILQKVYLERIIRKPEIDAFAEELEPHQMALLPDNSTALDRAMIEHNLLSVSRIYNNITFVELGTQLGIDPSEAEEIAWRMIDEDRIQGSIDQVGAVIHFEDDFDS